MSNYIELEDTIDLGSLIRGERRLGMDVAVKLSKATGTSITLWLNLQDTYDSLIKESKS